MQLITCLAILTRKEAGSKVESLFRKGNASEPAWVNNVQASCFIQECEPQQLATLGFTL